MAPTSASAQGTTEPTARNLDATATPHCCASRSQAQIEYVETSGGRRLAVGQLREVELEERFVSDEDARDLSERERRHDLLGAPGSDDDGLAFDVRGVDQFWVREVLHDECPLHVERPLERELGHLAPRGAEPALAHQNVKDSPGSGDRISTPGGARSRNASGVPVSSGKVP